MEYSIFEKIAYLLDNFESIDRVYINFSREEMKISLLCNEEYFSKEELIHHVKEYF